MPQVSLQEPAGRTDDSTDARQSHVHQFDRRVDVHSRCQSTCVLQDQTSGLASVEDRLEGVNQLRRPQTGSVRGCRDHLDLAHFDRLYSITSVRPIMFRQIGLFFHAAGWPPAGSVSMPTINIAFLGDIFGSPGRRVVQQQLPRLRQDHAIDVVVANAENARSGSGLSPELYKKIRGYGIDALTLGDHVYRDQRIVQVLQDPQAPIARPANLSKKAIGRPFTRIPPAAGRNCSVFVITVLGRVFFSLPADDPFAAVDEILDNLPERDGIVIVEAHMEATSEKAALAHYLDGRVAAVLGTHTHVPTADARVLKGGTAFMTDLGMCGPHDSIIGRDSQAVLRHMTTSFHQPFVVGTGGEAMCGAVITVDSATARANSIVPFRYAADLKAAPFA